MSRFSDADWEKSESVEAEPWDFEKDGNTLEGELTFVSDDIEGDYGTYRIYVIQPESGDPRSFIPSKVGRDKLDRAKAAVGDYVGVKFLGLKKSKNGRKYKDWAVAVQKAASVGSGPSSEGEPF